MSSVRDLGSRPFALFDVRPLLARQRQRCRDFQHVVGVARVAAGISRDPHQNLILRRELHRPKPAFVVLERAPQQKHDLLFGERLQHVHPAARQQRRVDFERRILGGCPNQPDVSFFHVRKKCVLLGLVEAMNFVDENHGASAVLPRSLGVGHDLLDFLDPGEHGAELDKLRAGQAGDDLRQRSLAGAGRPPEDQRAQVVALNLRPQRLAWRDQMLLPDELIERARTHAVGQRIAAVAGVVGVGNGLK